MNLYEDDFRTNQIGELDVYEDKIPARTEKKELVRSKKYIFHTDVDKEHGYVNIIGNDVWIGQRAVINVPSYAIVGVLAKIIGWRFAEEDRDFLIKLKWSEKEEGDI